MLALAQLIFVLCFIRHSFGQSVGIVATTQIKCFVDHPQHCWDGYSCFGYNNDICLTGSSLYGYGECGDCSWWDMAHYDLFCLGFDRFVGDSNYTQLPTGTTFSSTVAPFGTSPYLVYRLSRNANNYTYNSSPVTCKLWRAHSVRLTVNCPSGYYPKISTVSCQDINQNHGKTSGLHTFYKHVNDAANNNADCCYNCYSYQSGSGVDGYAYCSMCAQWDNMPSCQAGCFLPTLLNGSVAVTYDSGGPLIGVYPATATISYVCNSGYYLSTLTAHPLSATCTVIGNTIGNWTSTPTCLSGCPQLDLAPDTGSLSYVPTLPTYSPTGYVPQTILAVFNCTSGYYLDPPNYNYKCSGPNGIWDLGNLAPVCRSGCQVINSFPNGQVVYTPTTNLITGVYRWTTVATFSCYNGYYLSTLSTSTTTDCNVTGSWTNIPACFDACASLSFDSGTIWYSPNIPTYMSTGYVPQATLAIFNCSTNFYLDPQNYVYNCIGPNWDFGSSVPVCKAGCALPTLPNGTVTIIDASSLRNGVCAAGTTIIYECYPGYYLSTLNVAPLNATCTVSGNSGSWTAMPTCTHGCPQVTLASGTGKVSYVPHIPNYSPTGYVPQSILALFNCTSGYYLDPPNYTYNCTAPNGVWDLGPSPPVCRPKPCLAAPNITNMNTLTYTVEIADPKLNTNTTVAHYTCQTSFQLAGSGTTKCVNGNWTAPIPECNVIPLVVTVTKTVMTLSCSFLVIALGIIIVVTLLIRDFTIETCLHLNEEFALFFAHLLLLLFRDRVDLTDVCPAASAGIQYFFTTAFLCMMIEAIHSHAILQNVVSFGGVFDTRPRLKYFISGWFWPIIYTGITAAMRYNKYPSTYSCYVNLGDQIAIFIMGPIIVSFFLTIILTEAAAMGDWKSLPLASKQQRLAAHYNQKAMAPLVSLSLGSWFCSLLASYLNSPYIFTIGSGINMAFGVSIVVFHFIGNPKLNNWFHKKVLKKLCNKQRDS